MNIFGLEMNWLALAFMGMIFASLANITLQSLVKHPALQKQDFSWLALAAILLLFFLVIEYLVIFTHIKVEGAFLTHVALLVLFSVLAFGFVSFALKSGQVALVTAVLATSTAFIAVVSVLFLGARFTAKEWLAVALSVVSVALLAL